ncbi:hypothetical protein HanRHA438_Chr05g0209791 [Helianthus annuus]|nr:hypothetical protein HanRHA438_Chr05g0209791 [Helianthus annuus]
MVVSQSIRSENRTNKWYQSRCSVAKIKRTDLYKIRSDSEPKYPDLSNSSHFSCSSRF